MLRFTNVSVILTFITAYYCNFERLHEHQLLLITLATFFGKIYPKTALSFYGPSVDE